MKKILKVSDNRRFLQWEDGSPFFYLGDTAWELFHRLNTEEISYYLETRARQGFTTVQAVALAEFDGIETPNVYGHFPLKKHNGLYSPAMPDTDNQNNYWNVVEYTVEKAASLGLFISLLPTWGDKYNRLWGKGPEIFDADNAFIYGKWLGERYRDHWNIIWMLGGDRPLDTDAHKTIIRRMAQGLREGDGGSHLITFHPMGGKSSADEVLGEEYIDFNTLQSGHGVDTGYESYLMLRRDRTAEEKPFMNSEPRYEDHPACFNPKLTNWSAADVRMNLYWDILEGACGHTYGNHNIWSFCRDLTDVFLFYWQDALFHEGAETVQWAKKLRLSHDYFSLRAAPELATDDGGITAHVAAAKGDGYAYIYSPYGLPVIYDPSPLNIAVIRLSWFNPRTGETTIDSIIPGHRGGKLVPPTSGKGQDWVAVLEFGKYLE